MKGFYFDLMTAAEPAVATKLGLALLLFMLIGCQPPSPVHLLEGRAQGTTYHIRFYGDVDQGRLHGDLRRELVRLDRLMSGYRSDSTIERFNRARAGEAIQVGNEIVRLYRQAARVSTASHGCYDPTIQPLFHLWGFNNNRFTLPSPDLIHEALKHGGMDKIAAMGDQRLAKQDPSTHLDLSSIAQGYTADRLAEVLERRGIKDYSVEIGGEVLTAGRKPDASPWRIAVERPVADQRDIEAVVAIERRRRTAVVGSGTYRHFFTDNGRRYSHILDGRNGYPIRHGTVSVTVIGDAAADADAWSTALLCLGVKEGLPVADRNGVAALFIEQQGGKLVQRASQALRTLPGVRLD